MVGDPTPVITGVNPPQWSPSTTSVTITGSGFGTNPQLSVSAPGVGVTASILSASDNGQPGGATITANVSVPAQTCSILPVTITVTSQGYNGTGFYPVGGSTSSTTNNSLATIPPLSSTISSVSPPYFFVNTQPHLRSTANV